MECGGLACPQQAGRRFHHHSYLRPHNVRANVAAADRGGRLLQRHRKTSFRARTNTPPPCSSGPPFGPEAFRSSCFAFRVSSPFPPPIQLSAQATTLSL